jgi:NAD(P)-dependent dehydrogenase (short-subunit alcohol dehydrogenase family)
MDSNFDLSGLTDLVTGGGRGLGQAYARALAAAGAKPCRERPPHWG